MGHASFDTVLEAITGLGAQDTRTLVGIAGPPGSGKSTLAARLAARLGPQAAVLPMDGYHLDNATLEQRGLLHRKGAPQTFDAAGFVQLVRALRDGETVPYPTFDRAADRTVPGGGCIARDTRIVLIEGNYLLLDTPPWSALKPLFDLTVFLDVPTDVLRARLHARWRTHGLSPDQAAARADGNDMLNVALVQASSARADLSLAEEV